MSFYFTLHFPSIGMIQEMQKAIVETASWFDEFTRKKKGKYEVCHCCAILPSEILVMLQSKALSVSYVIPTEGFGLPWVVFWVMRPGLLVCGNHQTMAQEWWWWCYKYNTSPPLSMSNLHIWDECETGMFRWT